MEFGVLTGWRTGINRLKWKGEGNQRERAQSGMWEEGMVGRERRGRKQRKRRDTEAGGRYKLLFSHSAAIFWAPTRCQPQGQETEFLLLPNLPFIGRDRLAENRNESFRITNCDQYCEGNECGVERATVRAGEKGLLLQIVWSKVTSWRNALPFSRTRCILEEGRRGGWESLVSE